MYDSKFIDIINKNESFAIVIHVNPDGDCLGSSAALACALRSIGKTVDIFLDGEIPQRLEFVWLENFFGKTEKKYDVCIAVDVAAGYMMGNVKESVFDNAAYTCCVDHHGTNSGYAMCNIINAEASAAGEVVYGLLKQRLNIELNDDIARYLYIAIASDTGGFRYSNTTSETHKIASELMRYDIKAPLIMRRLFELKSIEQLRLKNDVVSNLRFYNDNKICVVSVDGEMLAKYQLTFEQADDLAQLPRCINGVEVGVYLKIKGEKDVKVSLRSNDCVDVSAVAAALGGGGHKRAAGVTLKLDALEAEKSIVSEILKVM